MTTAQIAACDYDTLRLISEGVIANFTSKLGFKDKDIAVLKDILTRYDTDVTAEPTPFTARLIAERRLKQQPDTEIPR